MAVFAATRVSSRCYQRGLRRRALSGQAYCGIPQGLQHCRTGRQQPHMIFTQRRRIDDHAQVQPSPPPMQPPASSEHLPAASLAAVAATAATRSSRRRSSGPAIRRRMIPPIAWPPAAQVYRPAASGWSTRVSREPAGRAYPAAHAWHGNQNYDCASSRRCALQHSGPSAPRQRLPDGASCSYLKNRQMPGWRSYHVMADRDSPVNQAAICCLAQPCRRCRQAYSGNREEGPHMHG